jgi:RNA polymerase sigma-70 factor (ECF subfamily)
MEQNFARDNNKKGGPSVHLVGNSGKLIALPPNEGDDFSILYKQYFPQVMQYIQFQNGTAHPEAEDIAQDIFLILWRRREKLFKIPPLELKYYLFVMVKNRLINESEKAITRRRIWNQIGEEPPKYAYTAHHELNDRRAERWLHSAIATLPPKRRTAYVLREQHGLKVHEIVALMGISQSGAFFLLQKAERQIRSFLARQII